MRTQCTVHTPFRAISYRFDPFQPYMSFHLSISRWKLYYPHFAYSIKIHAHIFVCECHFECFFVSLEMFSIKSPTSHNVLCGSNAENIFQIAPIQLRVLLVFVECTTESMWVFFLVTFSSMSYQIERDLEMHTVSMLRGQLLLKIRT